MVLLDQLSLFDDSSQNPHTALRREVRAFLDAELDAGSFEPSCNAWLEGHDPAFSRQIGSRGWIGMTWPREYGGQARTGIERHVVIEELLAAGAPVAAHWMADRQVGPSILRFGNEDHRHRFLPGIARGDVYFSIGLSEPDAGSDLASVRTTAHRTADGWRLNGTKVWTSHAHRSHYVLVLCRTGERDGSDRHAGLSQLIVDTATQGVTIRPVTTIGGRQHFAEVVFDDVELPRSALLGVEGNGWTQVTAELAHERGGPERLMSTFPLLRDLVAAAGRDVSDPAIGSLIADLTSLRTMSQTIARSLDSGAAPQTLAALVKDLGTTFENRVVNVARERVPTGSADHHNLAHLVADAIRGMPGTTLRGGTTEVLRGIIAKGILE